MRKALSCIAVALTIVAPAKADPTGNDLYSMCSNPITGDLACSAFVSGFAFGMNGQANADEAMPLFCYPQDAAMLQLAHVYRNYLTDNPELRHQPAVDLLVDAMHHNWACPESR